MAESSGHSQEPSGVRELATGNQMGLHISVVIPGFKPFFLHRALSSLVGQTDQNFEVVVADDGSPHDLATISESFAGKLDIRYIRFEENLGSSSLCKHWNRAVLQARCDWVWLLGNDDELEPGCIAAMRGAISAAPDWMGLWRVNVVQIDHESKLVKYCEPWAPLTTSLEYLKSRLHQQVDSYACEYVFRRSQLEMRGGFVDFPLAWCSDDATWLLLSGALGIRTVEAPNARARWRTSDKNISGGGSKFLATKHEARLRYLCWLEIQHDSGALPVNTSERAALNEDKYSWMIDSIHSNHTRLGFRDVVKTSVRLARAVNMPFWRALYQLMRVQRWIARYS